MDARSTRRKLFRTIGTIKVLVPAFAFMWLTLVKVQQSKPQVVFSHTEAKVHPGEEVMMQVQSCGYAPVHDVELMRQDGSGRLRPWGRHRVGADTSEIMNRWSSEPVAWDRPGTYRVMAIGKFMTRSGRPAADPDTAEATVVVSRPQVPEIRSLPYEIAQCRSVTPKLGLPEVPAGSRYRYTVKTECKDVVTDARAPSFKDGVLSAGRLTGRYCLHVTTQDNLLGYLFPFEVVTNEPPERTRPGAEIRVEPGLVRIGLYVIDPDRDDLQTPVVGSVLHFGPDEARSVSEQLWRTAKSLAAIPSSIARRVVTNRWSDAVELKESLAYLRIPEDVEPLATYAVVLTFPACPQDQDVVLRVKPQ